MEKKLSNPTTTRDRNTRHYNSEREGASIAEVRSGTEGKPGNKS